MVYSTLLGGTGFDNSHAITVDLNGRAHLTGVTDSPDFPTTPDAVNRTLHGVHDAFVTTVNAAGTRVRHSTFLGGTRRTSPSRCKASSDQGSRSTGRVASTSSATPTPPTSRPLATAFRHEPYRIADAFVTKLDPDLDDGDEDVR